MRHFLKVRRHSALDGPLPTCPTTSDNAGQRRPQGQSSSEATRHRHGCMRSCALLGGPTAVRLPLPIEAGGYQSLSPKKGGLSEEASSIKTAPRQLPSRKQKGPRHAERHTAKLEAKSAATLRSRVRRERALSHPMRPARAPDHCGEAMPCNSED